MYTLTFVFVAFSSCAYATQVYKCTAQSGKTSYQDTPCSNQQQQILEKLPSNSIQGPSITKPSLLITASPTAAQVRSTPNPTAQKADPNLPATENCSVDNPNRDREFCRPSNLNNVYGNPTLTKPIPRPRPIKH